MLASLLALGLMLNGPAHLPPVSGVDGKRHDVLAEAKGQPVGLVFIGHDCPICNSYAPELARIAQKYGKRVHIDFVYAEMGLSAAQAKRHAKTYDLTAAHLYLDPGGKLARACKAEITPEAVVFDTKGEEVYLGRIDDLFYRLGGQRQKATTHDLTDALDAVLTGKKPKPAGGPPTGCFIEFTK